MNKQRKDALDILLRPIVLCYAHTVEQRRKFVTARISDVLAVMPFLNRKEKQAAEKWVEDNRHKGLWD